MSFCVHYRHVETETAAPVDASKENGCMLKESRGFREMGRIMLRVWRGAWPAASGQRDWRVVERLKKLELDVTALYVRLTDIVDSMLFTDRLTYIYLGARQYATSDVFPIYWGVACFSLY